MPTSVRPFHGSSTSARPARVAPTSAALRAGRDVTRFMAFNSGHRVRTPDRSNSVAAHGPPAFTSIRARIVECLSRQVIARVDTGESLSES